MFLVLIGVSYFVCGCVALCLLLVLFVLGWCVVVCCCLLFARVGYLGYLYCDL